MKKITDIIWVIVLVCIFFIPFISSDVYQSTFSILCSVLLFSLFIHAILTKTYLKDHTITFWLLAWFSIIFTASLLCQHRNVALSSTYYFFLYGAIFFVISGLDYKKRRQVLIIIALTSVFISIRGILQNLYSFKTVIPYIESQKSVMSVKEFQHIKDVIERGRVVSSFVTANLFASYLTLVNFAVLRLIATIKRKTIVLALASLFLVNFFCLLLTASVAGLGAFTFGVFMFSVFSFLIVPKEKSALRKTCISLGIATTLLFVLLFAKRFFDTGTDNLLLSLAGRIQFWRTSLYIIKTRPFSFAGLGNFGYLFLKFAISPKAESTMAHNLILQLWIETGIYGLLAFIGFIAAVVNSAKRVIFSKTIYLNERIGHAALLSGVFAFLFHNMAGFSFFVPQVVLLWWILAALLISEGSSI